MITPLPLPVRPSCRLTWIEYRPFFMMWPVATSVTAAESVPVMPKRGTERQRGRLAARCALAVPQSCQAIYDVTMPAGQVPEKPAREMPKPVGQGGVGGAGEGVRN